MKNKIDKKYFVWIWLGLLFATFFSNIYPIYNELTKMVGVGMSGVQVATQVLLGIFSYGLVPMAVTFLLALVMWYICARRHSNYISRTDFCGWVMMFVAAVRLVNGIIDCFAILQPAVYVVTSTLYTVTALPAAMLVMFFCVFKKIYNLNPVERSNSFTVYSVVFMLVLGLSVLSENLTIVSIGANTNVTQELVAYLKEMGYYVDYLTAPVQVYSSIVAICVYFAYLIADIVVATLLKNKPHNIGERTQEKIISKSTPKTKDKAAIRNATTPATPLPSLNNSTSKRKKRMINTSLTSLIYNRAAAMPAKLGV